MHEAVAGASADPGAQLTERKGTGARSLRVAARREAGHCALQPRVGYLPSGRDVPKA